MKIATILFLKLVFMIAVNLLIDLAFYFYDLHKYIYTTPCLVFSVILFKMFFEADKIFDNEN